MTNGEKLKETFPNIEVVAIVPNEVVVTKKLDGDGGYTRNSFRYEWWNAEYKEPTTKNDLGVDCISRKAVLDAIDSKAWEFCDYLISKGRNDEQKPVSHFADNLRECVREELPSVTPQPCEDAVSRQEVLDLIADYDLSMGQVVKGIHALPSVTSQEPRKGHWIGHREHCENLGVMPSGLGAYEWCSNCDCGIDVREWHRNNYNFCPNCGADMREVEE